MIFVRFLIFLGISTSGLYLWSSGVPQISHLLLLAAATVYAFGRQSITYPSGVGYLTFFSVYAFIVNSFYWFIHEKDEFLISTAQIYFNLAIFVFLLSALSHSRLAGRYLINAIVLSFLVQWFIFILDLGNTQFFPRYAGTFNDPNQMAFWVLASGVSFFILTEQFQTMKFTRGLVFLSITFFVYVSMSRSALAATFVFLFVMLVRRYYSSTVFKVFALAAALVGLFIASLDLQVGVSNPLLTNANVDETIAKRIIETNISQQLDERGYSRFVDFPEYLVLGSGQGFHERFNQGKGLGFLAAEMHSTWGGLLHYYGLVGFGLFAIFMYRTLRNSDVYSSLLLFSTFLYGFSTYSFRTPIFWVLLAVFAFHSRTLSGAKTYSQ